MKPQSQPEPDDAQAERLSRKVGQSPKSPGVYLMKNREGEIIYVGKAANLRNRLSSYFTRASHMDAKTGVLVRNISDFETVVTGSEKEALILESNLIKRHKPRYNVILKDDKRYPSLRLDIRQKYPNLTVVRKIRKDGALYFGPYASAGAVRETIKLIQRNFKLRKCRDAEVKLRRRPCLNYQIGTCLGLCHKDIDPARYGEIVNEVRLFLGGQAQDLLKKIRTDMADAADRQDYEIAAQLRDKMFAVAKTLEKQVAVTTDFVDRDVVAVSRSDSLALIMLLRVRNGILQGMRDFTAHDPLADDAEMIGAFIGQYYESAEIIPREILTSVPIADQDLYSEWLSGLKSKKVEILNPRRGDRVRLLQMAKDNAAERLKAITDEADAGIKLLSGLQQRLGMDRYPHRIECVDNSGLSGNDLVSGIVVFENGGPKKSDYRHYRIRSVDRQDDYACMAEVLGRRYGDDRLPLPDLLMVDGGRGQLNIALAVLKKMGMEDRFTVIGIAKRDEAKGEPEDKIYLPGRVNPVNFTRHPREINYLKSIRDEAHRFAITFHRKRRNLRSLKSVLDTIPGIGEKRKTALLKYFDSIDRIRESSADEIGKLPGMNRKAATALLESLKEPESGRKP